MESKEAIERFERAEEAAEAREEFGRRAAILIAVLAAFLAVAGLLATRATEEVLLNQALAADTYAEYQANSLKKHINDDTAQTLKTLAAGTPNQKAAEDQAAKLLKANDDKYIPNQTKLLPKAQAYEHERDTAAVRHTSFQMSEAAFQLAIVLTTVAIVARSGALVYAGGGLGAVGLVFLANGQLLFFRLPSL